jgi:hypothetical protein
MPFVKSTELAFSMQFLCVGDEARVISGEMSSEIRKVVSTDHSLGCVSLEINIEFQHQKLLDFRLRDVECVFRLSDSVRVVVGVYLGLEGHIVQMSDNVFHICQEATKEEVYMKR